MKKRLFMFLLSLFLIVPSVFLVACGNNDNNNKQPVTIQRVEVTPKSGNHFTYIDGVFHVEAGYNPETVITKDAFTVVLYYSDNSTVDDFKDYTLNVTVSEYGNYVAEVKYENYCQNSYDIIVNDEILDTFVGVTQEQDDQGNRYYLYTNNEIVYKGAAYNILDEIKTSAGVSISTLIEQDKVYLNSEFPGEVSATNVNDHSGDYIYYYRFSLYASNGYVWQIDGQDVYMMEIKWQILPQEISITAPVMTTVGALEYNGANQIPEFSFDVNTEQYFDMHVENNQHKDVGEYTYVINLKNEYSTSNNYHFTINDSTNVHQNADYVGYVQLEASWIISPKQLAINASDIAITNNDGTKQYEGEETVYPRFVYNPNGITIETNVDSLTDVFDIDGHIEGVGGDCIYYYGITLQEGAAGNYVYANGATVTEGVGLPYYVAEAQGSLPTGMPANIILNSTTFNNDSLYNYSFNTDMIDTSEGKTVISQEVLDALDAASLSWKDSYQVLNAGTNEVVVLYKVLNYTAVEFTVTWPVEKAELQLTLSWHAENNGSGLVYRATGYSEAYVSTYGDYDNHNVQITYNTTYKEFGGSTYGTPSASRTEGNTLYLIDAGLYKTTATLTCNENYYLTYDGYVNEEKLSSGTAEIEWKIERAELSSYNYYFQIANYTTIQMHDDGNGNLLCGYYAGSAVDIDYVQNVINFINDNENIIEINGEKYTIVYQRYNSTQQVWEETEEFDEVGLYRVVFTLNLNKNYYIDAETINVEYLEFNVYDTNYTLSSVSFDNDGTYTYTGNIKTSTPTIESIEGLKIEYTYYYSNDNEISDVANFDFVPGTYKVSAKITAIKNDYLGNNFENSALVKINTTDTEYLVNAVTFTIAKKQLNKSNFEIKELVGGFYDGTVDNILSVVGDLDQGILSVLNKTVVLTLDGAVVDVGVNGVVLNPNTTYVLTLTVKLDNEALNKYELLETNENGEWVYTANWITGKHQVSSNVFEFDASEYDAFPTITNIRIKGSESANAFPAGVNWENIVDVTFAYMTYDQTTGDTELLDVDTPLESGKHYKVVAFLSIKDEFTDDYEVIDYLKEVQLEWDKA